MGEEPGMRKEVATEVHPGRKWAAFRVRWDRPFKEVTMVTVTDCATLEVSLRTSEARELAAVLNDVAKAVEEGE